MTAKVQAITVSAKPLRDAISLIRHCMADDLSRPILATLILDGTPDGLKLMAADNFRIGVATVPAVDADFGRAIVRESDVPLIVAFLKTLWAPSDQLVIANTPDTVTLTHVAGRPKPRCLTVEKVDGAFPDVEPIIGKQPELSVALNPAFLRDLGSATKETPVLRIHVGGPLEPVMVEAKELGYAEWIMPVRIAELSKPEPVPAEAAS